MTDNQDPAAERPDRIDGYLSRKLQQHAGPKALVLERPDGSWVYRLDGKTIYALGESFGDAKAAIFALIASIRAFNEEHPNEDPRNA